MPLSQQQDYAPYWLVWDRLPKCINQYSRLRHYLEVSGQPYAAADLPPGKYLLIIIVRETLMNQVMDSVQTRKFSGPTGNEMAIFSAMQPYLVKSLLGNTFPEQEVWTWIAICTKLISSHSLTVDQEIKTQFWGASNKSNYEVYAYIVKHNYVLGGMLFTICKVQLHVSAINVDHLQVVQWKPLNQIYMHL